MGMGVFWYSSPRPAVPRALKTERLRAEGKTEKPASQVGNRRYARGRAYVPDRYSNPETAEEATLKAAQESEDAEAIDETVEDDVLIPEAAADTEAETADTETETETPEEASDAETE